MRVYNSGAWNMIYLIWMLDLQEDISRGKLSNRVLRNGRQVWIWVSFVARTRWTLPRIIRVLSLFTRPPCNAKFQPERRFEFTMLPASWVPTRSYPLQLQPCSKLRGPTPTHRSGLQLIPSVVWKRSNPLQSVRSAPRLFQAWFRIVSFLPVLHHGFPRVSWICETVSTVSHEEERAKSYLVTPISR